MFCSLRCSRKQSLLLVLLLMLLPLLLACASCHGSYRGVLCNAFRQSRAFWSSDSLSILTALVLRVRSVSSVGCYFLSATVCSASPPQTLWHLLARN